MKKIKKSNKGLGLKLIFVGVILLLVNIFLLFNEPKDDMGKLILSSLKIGLTKNNNVLVFASMASWVVPLLFILTGIIIAKRSTKNDDRDFFQ